MRKFMQVPGCEEFIDVEQIAYFSSEGEGDDAELTITLKNGTEMNFDGITATKFYRAIPKNGPVAVPVNE